MKNTKSLLALFLACMMVISCFVVTPVMAEDIVDEWDGKTDTSWYNTTDTVFTLTTAEQVAGLAELVNGGNEFSGKTIKLGTSIQLNDTADFANWSTTAPTNKWVPIGGYSGSLNKGFAGTFDGQGYKIIGMYVKEKDGHVYERVGFIGQKKGATISNVIFENCYAQGSASGIVVGWVNGMPTFNNVDVINSTMVGGSSVGFLIGQSGGGIVTATNCDISGTISGASKIGSIIGNAQSNSVGLNVEGGSVNVTVKATGSYSGGLVGQLGYSNASAISAMTVKNCKINVDITAPRDFGAVIGSIYAKSCGAVTFEGLDVEANVKATGSSVNYQGIAILFGYTYADSSNSFPCKIESFTVKDTDISGSMSCGQNAAIMLGRVSGGVGSINIQNVTSDVDVSIMTGTGAAQCVASIVGLSQKDMGTLTVNGYTSANTYTVTDENGAVKVGELLGGVTVGTVSISGADVDVAYTGVGNAVGGLLGDAITEKITISGSEIKANVASTGIQVGGIVSRLKDGASLTITGTNLDVTVAGAENVGGLFASSTGAIELTINGSDIKANVDGGEAAGGIANSIDSADAVISAINSKLDITSTGKTLVATTDATLSYRNTTITPADEELLGMEIIKDTSVIDVWDGSIAENFADGTGTAEDPYVIETGAQLAYFAQEVNANNADVIGAHVVLAANIQLNSDEDMANFASWSTTAPANKWNPIGGYSSELNVGFAGSFDGQGYKIIGMYVKAQDENVFDRVGFFGQTKSIAISNVTFENCWAYGASSGIVVGWGNGMPSFNNVDVIDSVIAGNNDSVGFLLGQSGGGTFTAKNCDVSGTISGKQKVGGLFGNHQGSTVGLDVDNCTIDVTIISTGKVDGDKNGNAGAIVGSLGYSSSYDIGDISVKNTTVKADVTSTRDFGALIGYSLGKSVGTVTFENLDVDARLTPSGSSVNYQGIAMLFGYAQITNAITTFTVKDVDVKGNIFAGQNAGIILGRVSGPIETFTVEGFTSNVDFVAKKGTGGVQAFGGVIGLAQKAITTFNVSDSVFNDTFDGTSQIGGVVGQGMFIEANMTNVGVKSTIKSASGSDIGGFIGTDNTTASTYGASTFNFEGCYFTGSIIGASTHAAAFIGDYDPASGNATATSSGKPSGTLNVKNCYVDADMSCATNVAGVIGRSWPKNFVVNVEDSVFLGAYTGTTRPALVVGLLAGSEKETEINTMNELVTLNNVYFNVTGTTALVGHAYSASGVNVLATDNVFYTPAAVDGKQPDLAILGFVEDMKGIKNTDGSTPAWFSLKHTCESVDFAEGNTYGDVADTFTLACQKPGCDHFHIEKLGAKFGASIRTGENAGLRFGFRFNSDLIEGEGQDINAGILLIPTDLLTGELTVDTAKAINVKAEKSFTSGKYYEEGAYSFAGVLTGIPEASLDREITARAYIVIDGITYYTETAATSYNNIAEAVAAAMAE